MEQVEVGGLTFDVVLDGDPDAPALLLLHGFPQSAHCWRQVIPQLQDYRVIAPDQRGYSPGARPESYRMHELAADAVGLLDALEVEQAHVVGHDWGAAVAWQLGARHPSRVRTLTPISVPHPQAFIAALRADDEQRQKSLYMRDFAKPGFDEVLLADEAAMFRGLFGGAPVDVEDMLSRARQPGALASWLRWYADQRLEDIVDTPVVTVPTMHVWSDGDVALGRAGAEGTAAWVSAAYRFEVLSGVSHWIPEEAPGELGALLREHCR